MSLRSDGTIDVAEIASSFGGGGHSSAAGFNIESGANQRYDFFGTNAKFDNLINLLRVF